MSRLRVAGDQAWLACFGVRPGMSDDPGDGFVSGLRLPVTNTEEVQITWDVTHSSVRVRHHRGGRIVLDLFRELATLLTVVGSGPSREVVIEYGSDGWLGRTRVQLLPEVLIHDTVLRS